MDKFTSALGNFGGGDKTQSQGDMTSQAPQGSTTGHPQPESQQSGGGGGFMSSLSDKFNSAAGGGKESEKNEDYLDKGVDFVQERFTGGGDQSNESAVEQAKDEQISDFIRDKYKSTMGNEMPIKDKETRFG